LNLGQPSVFPIREWRSKNFLEAVNRARQLLSALKADMYPLIRTFGVISLCACFTGTMFSAAIVGLPWDAFVVEGRRMPCG
jgi:hypothetical protein